MAPVYPSSQRKIECRDCALYELCEPVAAGPQILDLIEPRIRKDITLDAGEQLTQEEQPADFFYAVTTGSFKLVNQTLSGQQVTGFLFPGDLIGHEAQHRGQYGATAIALEPSRVCGLSIEDLRHILGNVHPIYQRLINLYARHAYLQFRQTRLIMPRTSAAGKLGAFLFDLHLRASERGFDGLHLRLPMNRADIASFLGLTQETLSRVFTRLKRDGVLEVSAKHIRILNLESLQRLAAE
ncbi:helix-turn-helix domain-containing protein [Hahella sp. SMD15-11]|uniref:Helix-turn-helix domain-containing protein n=1 Tax=Thermohahella caldifontis TaxID=3142973 RepID=A0AB39UYE1_9GAMM